MHYNLNSDPKGASTYTKEVHRELKGYLNFEDRRDFNLASLGLLLQTPRLTIKNNKGATVWDLESYSFLNGECPETVNPSLWRISQLNMVHFEQGEYRFVAQVLNWVVFAYPTYSEARMLLADTLEQMGYQTENGNWRNSYLTGAFELRHLSPSCFPDRYPALHCFTEESISGLTSEMMLDYLAIRLDIGAARGKVFQIPILVEDRGEKFVVEVKNCVMNYRKTASFPQGNPVAFSHEQLGKLALLAPDCSARELGLPAELDSFIHIFEQFGFWFNMIED